MANWTEATEENINVIKVNNLKMQIIIDKEEEIRAPGISFSGRTKLFKQESNLIIIKVAGGSSWSGIGETTYYRPQYIIGTIEDQIMIQKYIIEYGRSTMKKGKQKALELFETLKGE